MYKVKVETTDGQKKEFIASYPYVLDESTQKVVWKTTEGEVPITNLRIKVITEERQDGSKPKVP